MARYWAVCFTAAAAISGAAAAPSPPPPLSLFPGVNAAFSMGSGGAGESGPYYKFVGGGFSSSAACGAAAAAWANASEPAQRCLSATFFRAPRNASFLDQCYCNVEPRWIPLPSDEADSARLLWPCASSLDCSYNGECDAGSGLCSCDAAWGGPRCSELQLLPVDAAHPGLRLVDADGRNVSTWGAPMLRDPATGTWHAWASEMEYGCGINSWETNSHIVHATAAQPGGPWTRREEVFATFAHAPDVVRGPAGEWVMALASFPLPAGDGCADCADGITRSQPHRGGCGPDSMHSFRTLLAVAASPDGPWEAVELRRLDASIDWNTALAINGDGSAVALLREGMTWAATDFADNTTWRAVGSGMGTALPDADVEDPYVYKDARGTFHSLFHAMDVGDDQAFCGGHAFSADGGVTWVYTGLAFSNAANFTDGSLQVFSRRERPHFLFAADGVTIIALSSGVQFAAPPGVACSVNGSAAPCDPVFTLVQPVRQAAERTTLN